MDALESFDLGGGVIMRFGPQDHQGTDEVFLTRIKDGMITPLAMRND